MTTAELETITTVYGDEGVEVTVAAPKDSLDGKACWLLCNVPLYSFTQRSRNVAFATYRSKFCSATVSRRDCPFEFTEQKEFEEFLID